MAITFFDDQESSGSNLPFVNEYVRTPDAIGSIHDIISITPSRKGNGLVLKTESFVIFIWKKSKACTFVMNAVKAGEDECGYPLVVKLKKSDPYYDLGLDSGRTAFFSQDVDDFTERTSYELVLLPLETSSKSHSPKPISKNKTRPVA